MNTTRTTIVFWVALFIVAVLLYSAVQRDAASLHATIHQAPPQKKIEYSITPVVPSTDLRAMLEMRGNEGWNLPRPLSVTAQPRRSSSNARGSNPFISAVWRAYQHP